MENIFHTTSATASGTVTAKRFGKYNANGQVAQCTTAGQDADGVINGAAGSTITTGVMASIDYDGQPLEVTAGAAIAAGAIVETDANGKAVTQTTGKGLGRAKTAAAADGDVIEIQWFRKAFATDAANPDTSGATLAALETEVNEMKASLRKTGIIAP